jgi:hypothetical protein
LTEPKTSPFDRIIAGWPLRNWLATLVVAGIAAFAAAHAVRKLVGKDDGIVATSATGQPTASANPQFTATGTGGGTVSVPESPQPGRTTATTTRTTAAPAGPRIVSFRVKTAPTCPAGTDLNPIDGTPVTLEWEVAGAESTELAVDGPGKYADYKVKDSVTLNFGCSGAPNTDAKHTYTLTTIGGGPAAKQTLTVTAKINEIAHVSPPAGG